MKFVQIIEYKTNRIDEFNVVLDAAIAKSEGRIVPELPLRT